MGLMEPDRTGKEGTGSTEDHTYLDAHLGSWHAIRLQPAGIDSFSIHMEQLTYFITFIGIC